MQKTILAMMFGAAVLAASTTQATMASERHDIKTTDRAVASENYRNSRAYLAPDDAVPSRWSGYDGALGSGIAGH